MPTGGGGGRRGGEKGKGIKEKGRIRDTEGVMKDVRLKANGGPDDGQKRLEHTRGMGDWENSGEEWELKGK